MTAYLDQMHHDGVIILKNQIAERNIELIKNEINKIREYVLVKISTLQRPLKTYTDIAERQLNRLDYRCGFTANIFQEVAKPISTLIQSLSPRVDFTYYWGAIPSLPGSGPTDIHRDIYSVYNNLAGNEIDQLDLNLPPYYFTVLIPLVQITEENGPTEFIKGSHRIQSMNDIKQNMISPLVSPGDIIIFEGRTLHRGRENTSNAERLIAYITFTAKWYYDQTFVMNNYLFPELFV